MSKIMRTWHKNWLFSRRTSKISRWSTMRTGTTKKSKFTTLFLLKWRNYVTTLSPKFASEKISWNLPTSCESSTMKTIRILRSCSKTKYVLKFYMISSYRMSGVRTMSAWCRARVSSSTSKITKVASSNTPMICHVIHHSLRRRKVRIRTTVSVFSLMKLVRHRS